jgi:hypothetical protein
MMLIVMQFSLFICNYCILDVPTSDDRSDSETLQSGMTLFLKCLFCKTLVRRTAVYLTRIFRPECRIS